MDRIGRYKIVRELGRGAMGVVYHAIDPNIGRPVAIKTIHLSAKQPEEQNRMRERLFREARSAGILSHPGIVTIYDVEQQGDLAYIAMEYVDGPTLDQLLFGEPISGSQLFSVLAQTAVALDYAHGKGIVHRDIKPANIMIAAGGTAKITDFGIAKISASEHLTMTGNIVGTPHYMSPEQVQGQAVDGRSDQFSLAVIAFEVLTGEKPFTGEHLTTVVYKIVAEEPSQPHNFNPSLSPAIESVIRRALSKKAESRYRTCQEFIDSLEKACGATPGWKTMARGGTLNEPTATQTPKATVNLPPARRPRRIDSTGTSERETSRKSGFLTFLLALLVAAGLLSLIGYQALPWLTPAATHTTDKKPAKPNTPPPVAQTPPQPAAPAPAATDPKPSPMSPATDPAVTPPAKEARKQPAETERLPGEEPPARPEVAKADPRTIDPRKGSSRAAAAPQPVTVITSPGGATAVLDGRSETACTTPCSLDATPGRHMIAVTLTGYGIEQREVDVGSSPMEMSAIVLRAQGGTLMLSSSPAGASILVNGKRQPQTTPTTIVLSPGTYNITVEKDGKQSTKSVDIRNGNINYLKITMQ